jgi:hypothetical protein
MTTELNTEHLLQRWLVDGVNAMPDRVYLSILDRVERQPQRRAWRVPWRDSTVNTYLKPIVAIAAVLAVAVAGFALLSQPSGPTVGVTAPTLSPSPSVASSPTPTPAWNRYPLCGSGDPPCGGPLEAGTYTSQGFEVPVTYTLTTPWVNTSDWPDYFILYPDTPANRALNADPDAVGNGGGPYILMTPTAVVSPSDACSENAPDATRVNANGFRDFLDSRDGLSVTGAGPGAITLSGLSGQQFDVDIAPGWTGCLPGINHEIPPTTTDHLRYIVLDRGGDSLVITLWAPTKFQRFLSEAMPIVESFQFDLGPDASPS